MAVTLLAGVAVSQRASPGSGQGLTLVRDRRDGGTIPLVTTVLIVDDLGGFIASDDFPGEALPALPG